MASCATSSSAMSGMASRTAATIICSNATAYTDTTFMKVVEKATLRGFHNERHIVAELEQILRTSSVAIGHSLRDLEPAPTVTRLTLYDLVVNPPELAVQSHRRHQHLRQVSAQTIVAAAGRPRKSSARSRSAGTSPSSPSDHRVRSGRYPRTGSRYPRAKASASVSSSRRRAAGCSGL